MELDQHLEAMQHEICGCDLELTQQGYRVDGRDGIKINVGSPNSKSVDYFYLKNNNCIFVEFSDIARGEEDLLPLQEHRDELMNDSDESRKQMGRQLQKMLKVKMKDELVTKFKDSYRIHDKIPDYYQQYPKTFDQSGAKTFYIVHAPINPELPERQKERLAAFLSRLQEHVSCSLDDDMCDRVKLMLVEKFAEQH